MRNLTAVFSGLIFLAIAGCGSNSSPEADAGDSPPVQGLLSPVNDVAEFEASIKSSLMEEATPERLAVADTVATAKAAEGNFTGTYTQELNVDELDAVRYDGGHLYIAPRRFYRCCFIRAEAGELAGDERPVPERSIRILSTDPVNAGAGVVGTIPIEDNVSVQGMYFDADRLLALTGQASYGYFGDLWTVNPNCADIFGLRTSNTFGAVCSKRMSPCCVWEEK